MKSDTTVYTGRRLPEEGQRPDSACECLVQCDGKELKIEPSLRVRKHSPTGFNWGYAGSGPAQLALAVLLDFTGNRELAEHHYQDFKFHCIARLEVEADWQLSGGQIREWLEHAETIRPLNEGNMPLIETEVPIPGLDAAGGGEQ